MLRVLSFFILSLFFISCSSKANKQMWESSTVNFAFTSCQSSLKIDFNRNKKLSKKHILNDEKVVRQCSCAVDDLRENISQTEFVDYVSNKTIGKYLSASSKKCKEKFGAWYDVKESS